MKIIMRVQMSGTRDGQPWPAPGDTITLSDDEATQLCDQGNAKPAVRSTVESGAVPEVETAAVKPSKRKG